jgi:LuxR family quorum sensing-dependent transcriptional regulator
MMAAVTRALDLSARFDTAPTAETVGRFLLASIASYGARSIFSASFKVPPSKKVEEFTAGRHLFAQQSPRGWIEAYYQRGLHTRNPVVFASARRATAFRWSDPGFDDLKNWPGFDLARDLGIGDGLTIPFHVPGNRVGVVSFGFERLDLSRQETLTIALTAAVAHERMMQLSPPAATSGRPTLTPRERDCLAFVAEGLSDADIGEKLGISQTTAHAHVEGAKRKLGAKTRAQAVARLYALGLF